MADSLFNKLNSSSIAPGAQPAPMEPAIQEPETLQSKIKKQPIESGLPALPSVVASPKKLDEFSNQVRQGLDSENQSWMKAQTDELKKLNEEAKRIYQEDKSRVDTAKVAELIGHALTQIGYGMAGLKSKTYGGPLQFNKADWESKYRNILDEYKMTLDQGRSEIDAEQDSLKSRSAQRERIGSDKINQAERLYFDYLNESQKKQGLDKPDSKKAPKLESEEAILKEFREIEKLRAQYAEAKSDSEKAKLMGDIYVKLADPSEKAVPLKELKEMSAQDKKPWYNFWAEDTDKFGEYIDSVKQQRLNKLRGENQAKLEEAGLAPQAKAEPAQKENAPSSTIKVQMNGQVFEIPRENLKQALQRGATEVK